MFMCFYCKNKKIGFLRGAGNSEEPHRIHMLIKSGWDNNGQVFVLRENINLMKAPWGGVLGIISDH